MMAEEMEGIDFSPDGIRNAKDKLTDIRDALFKEAPPDWERISFFTHIIVYLGDYALKVEREKNPLDLWQRAQAVKDAWARAYAADDLPQGFGWPGDLYDALQAL
jgi:hypothetical protein